MNKLPLVILLFGLTCSSFAEEAVEYVNANVYTMDAQRPRMDGLCVVNGKVAKSCIGAPQVDLGGHTVLPGFIDAHGHLTGIGFAQINLDLSQATSYEALIRRVGVAADLAAPGEWILGRGWHQSKWTPAPELVDGFQTHEKLSAVSPDNPVYLVHASGHAAFANAKAMELAGIDAHTSFSGDGEVIRDAAGAATGAFNELAQGLIAKHIPPPSAAQKERALELALAQLAKNGVTSFHDAGAGDAEIDLYKSFMAQGKLTSRVWVMLSGRDAPLLQRWFTQGPQINLADDRLTIRAVKLVADGALGSRGAWLLDSYSDRNDHLGLPTMSIEKMQDIAHLAYQRGFQVATHAIGDRANREVLNIYDALFDGRDRGVRFRIEHAQHIDPADIPRFGQLGVIASVQGIHLSSDRPWAIDRLGKQRIEKGAYVWRKLLDTGAILANGTDAPVEPLSALASFYALVSRQTLAGDPPGGYEPSQKLTRLEALRAYTLDAAYAAHEEDIKGSLVPGKWADFVVLDRDIMDPDLVPDADILKTRILQTVVGGKTIHWVDPKLPLN